MESRPPLNTFGNTTSDKFRAKIDQIWPNLAEAYFFKVEVIWSPYIFRTHVIQTFISVYHWKVAVQISLVTVISS